MISTKLLAYTLKTVNQILAKLGFESTGRGFCSHYWELSAAVTVLQIIKEDFPILVDTSITNKHTTYKNMSHKTVLSHTNTNTLSDSILL